MTTFPERIGISPTDPGESGRPGDDAGQRLTVTEDMNNVNGGLHGGIIATMLDTTMGAAVRAGLDDDQSAATVSMTVTFLAPGKVGDELVASAEIRRRGGSLVLVEGDVTRKDDDTAIAHAVATFSVVSKD